ncbi:MAG: tetratricopeptide repeat protein [Acidobacteriota bacterium]
MIKVISATLLLAILLTATGQGRQLPAAAADDFQKALSYFQSSRYRDSLALLKSLEQRFPESAEVHHLLAIVLDLSEEPVRANHHFERAVELNPDSAPMHVNYGTSLRRLGRTGQAMAQFRKALELDPGNGTASFNLGTILLEGGEVSQARVWLEKAYQQQPGVYENGYQLAYCYFLLRQHQQAQRVLSRLRRFADRRAEVKLLVALNERALGRGGNTATQLAQLLPLLADHPEVEQQVVILLFGQGLYAEAVTLLEARVSRDAHSYSSWFHLARARLRTGQLEGARDAALKAMELKESSQVHALLGDIFEARKEPLQAVEHFQKAARLDPSETNLYALGFEFLIHWNWTTASQVFDQALSKYPQSWSLWLGKGAAALGLNQNEEATQAFLKAIQIAPGRLLGYHLLAQSFEQSKQSFETAASRFEKLARSQPEKPWAVYYGVLARFRKAVRSGQLGEIPLGGLVKVLASQPDFFEGHLLAGEIYFDQQRWRQCAAALQEALRLNPDHAQGHYKLGLALRRLGRDGEAAVELKKYQELKRRQDQEVSQRVAATTKFIIELKKP